MKTISNSQLSIQVSPNGAELCSIVSEGKEYLWQADPAFWKRHSPVLFPIVGSVWENEYRVEGTIYNLPQHGFARDMDFELILERSDEVRYRLTDNEETRKKYPFPFCLEIGYRIQGKQIEVLWEVRNTGDEEMYFQIGAHPAFYFPGFDATSNERGYFGFDKTEELEYILISEKGCANPDHKYPLKLTTDGLLPLDTHTFDKGALILENGQVKKVMLYNKEKKPYLSLHFTAPVVGLWSPPAKNAPFVCIEPWYGRCDRAHYTGEYKDKDWMQHLQPSEVFKGGYIIKIEE
ncbi:aldose 1-epimerase family protein [Bacteroides sp.]